MEPNIPSVDNLDTATQDANAMIAGSRMTIDLILEAHAEERDRIAEEREKAEERHSRDMENQRKHFQKVIIALLIPYIILIFGAFYIFANYDIVWGSSQSAAVGGDGSATIYDGIHLDGE